MINLIKPTGQKYIHDLGKNGNEHVTVNGECGSDFIFGNVTEKIEHIEWMDNREVLAFDHKDSVLSIDATGFDYGISTCVRVAKATLR